MRLINRYTTTAALTFLLALLSGCQTQNYNSNRLSGLNSPANAREVSRMVQNTQNSRRRFNSREMQSTTSIDEALATEPGAAAMNDAKSGLKGLVARSQQYRSLADNLRFLPDLSDVIDIHTLNPDLTTHNVVDRGDIVSKVGPAIQPLDNMLKIISEDYDVYRFIARGTDFNRTGLSAMLYIAPKGNAAHVKDDLDLGFDLFYNVDSRKVMIHGSQKTTQLKQSWVEGAFTRDIVLSGATGVLYWPNAAINIPRVIVREMIDNNGETKPGYNGSYLGTAISGRPINMYDLINTTARQIKVENHVGVNAVYAAMISVDDQRTPGFVIGLGNKGNIKGNMPLSYMKCRNNIDYGGIQIDVDFRRGQWILDLFPIGWEMTRTKTNYRSSGGNNPPIIDGGDVGGAPSFK